MSAPTTPPIQLLRALAAARGSMPRLVKNDTGYDAEDKIFTFPKEEDLRDAVAMVFAEHGLMEVIGDAVATAGFLATTWSLHHLESGESITHQITWPIDSDRRLSRPHSAAAAWSHAWRHFMTKLLAVRTVAQGERRDPRVPSGGADLDRSVGPMPPWAGAQAPVEPEGDPDTRAAAADVPWRAQQRLLRERAEPVDTSPEAPWSAIGAVVEEPAQDLRPNFDIWAELCSDMRMAGVPKRWEFVIGAWHEFSGRTNDVLAPEDQAFKAWLKGQVAEWIRKNAKARPA